MKTRQPAPKERVGNRRCGQQGAAAAVLRFFQFLRLFA
jgi:hypothetical protein